MSDTELLTQTTCPLEQLEEGTYIKVVKTPEGIQVQCRGDARELISMVISMMDEDSDLKKIFHSAVIIHLMKEGVL